MFEQLLLNSINNNEKLNDETFEYKSTFLSAVIPDPTNGRFLPAIFIEDEHASQFVSRRLTKSQLSNLYNGEGHVLIGKSILINCLPSDSEDWKRANKTIESIIELGANISVSEMIQVPTIFPIGNGKYQILTGHRRFFALVYAKGYGSAAQFKVYDKKPLLTKVKQFQENASREDLPQYGKLHAFINALTEIEQLNKARAQAGLSRLTVREIVPNLGISMGGFDNYNVLTRYPVVVNAYESGCTHSFIKMKKLILSIEREYKEQNEKSVLNAVDKKEVSNLIQQMIEGKTKPKRKKTEHSFTIKKLQSQHSVKRLLTEDMTKLEIGVDWDTVNWEDPKELNDTIDKIVKYLNNE